MKETLSTLEVADRLFKDRENNGFTYGGCFALAEWLEELEADIGEEMELDIVAIRCDFSEAVTAFEYMHDYMTDDQFVEEFCEAMAEGDDELEEACLEYIRDNSLVIEFDGGVIVQAF